MLRDGAATAGWTRKLTATAVNSQLSLHGAPSDGETLQWEAECEQGARLFLRSVLLAQRSAQTSDRLCEVTALLYREA